MSCRILASRSEKYSLAPPSLFATAMAPMVRPCSSTCGMGRQRSDSTGPPTSASSVESDRRGTLGVLRNSAGMPSRTTLPTTPSSQGTRTAASSELTSQICLRTSSAKKTEHKSDPVALPASFANASTYLAMETVGDERTLRNLMRGRYSSGSSASSAGTALELRRRERRCPTASRGSGAGWAWAGKLSGSCGARELAAMVVAETTSCCSAPRHLALRRDTAACGVEGARGWSDGACSWSGGAWGWVDGTCNWGCGACDWGRDWGCGAWGAVAGP
mmetsp:Transcript_75302/g.207733  ORF Transcript_75302/g.207733 Transcript_75302/m.207733 type:complete len:275 (-) Transcript_75302:1136-1960(-)